MPACHDQQAERVSQTRFKVALAGTPNSGKTTLFNQVSRMRHKVANYPGVTVEKRSATIRRNGMEFELIDLPGMYGFSSDSQDEVVARDYCLHERPDLIIAVLDASVLERGLYLAVQWLKLEFPMILALNMIDQAERRGMQINAKRLSEILGVPVVPMIAKQGKGVDELLDAVEARLKSSPTGPMFQLALDTAVDDEVSKLVKLLRNHEGLANRCPPRWLAQKLLEGDDSLARQFGLILDDTNSIAKQIDESVGRLTDLYQQPPAAIFSNRRHEFAHQLAQDVVTKGEVGATPRSDQIDRIATNPYLGLPLFLLVTYLVFEFAFRVGAPPMGWIEAGVAWLSGVFTRLLPDGALQSLVVDGIIGGVGGVIVFLPNIVLLFVAIAFLEDSGYMVRGAAVMDRLMNKLGLHGKSFIPLILGFGCNVPAIMAARTLENRRDRLVTILVTPLMSCSARLPVYMLFISAFFEHGAPVLFSIYLIGIVMAIGSAIVFRRTILRGRHTPFIVEMPPYRMPQLRTVAIHAWDRAWMYLKKAGTIILLLSIVIWFLSAYPKPPEGVEVEGADAMRYSVAGSVGNLFEPVLKPIGLGDWKVGVALISGFAAKEVVVSAFGTLYNVGAKDEGTEALRNALRADPIWNPLSAYSMMLFILIYIPCLPAMIIMRRETGSWKWVAFQIAYTTAAAWTVAFIVYQGGRLLGLGG